MFYIQWKPLCDAVLFPCLAVSVAPFDCHAASTVLFDSHAVSGPNIPL